MSSTSSPQVTARELRSRLPELMVRDAHRLSRRLDGLRKARRPKPDAVASIAKDVERAEERLRRRRESLPEVTYPEELPVSARRDDLADVIRDNQVVIVAGETGSGKTTQLPKICLELG
ncbi:hypothetical protein, partial [Saccharomonospora viridis]